MSDDFVIDISMFDGLDSSPIEDVESGDAPESSLGKTWFGKWRYFHIKVDWAKGSEGFPLPGVYLDRRMDDGSYVREPGAYKVKGAYPNPNSKNFVDLLVCERVSQSGKAYHTVLKFTAFDKLRKEYQYPAIKAHLEALQATGRKAFEMARQGKSFNEINAVGSGAWVFGKGEYTESKLPQKDETGEPRVKNGEIQYQKYVDNFQFWPTEVEAKKAEADFWAERGGGAVQGSTNGTSAAFDASKFPAMWAKASNMPTVLFDKINAELAQGKEAKTVAIACMLMEASGKAKDNADGDPVDVAEIFGLATGMPGEMFTF